MSRDAVAKMDNLINARRPSGTNDFKGLAQRYDQLTNLPLYTLRGHVRVFQNMQRQLQKLLNTFRNDDCGAPPDGVSEGVSKPLQDIIKQRLQDIDNIENYGVDGVLVVGAGYLAYRFFRLLPSLLPPLWGTIPLNLAIP